MYIHRHIEATIKTLLEQFPAILVTGARQVGKSTMLQHIAPQHQYITLDDPLALDQARQEPTLFFMNYNGKLILDEVQYAPELFRSLKQKIDQSKENGVFLLSGSQAFELMHNISETLAGRVAIITLKGLSMREILGIDFDEPFIPHHTYIENRQQSLMPYENIWEVIHKGDMPKLHSQDIHWEIYYRSYVTTYIERDVRQLTHIKDHGQFARFMVALAARSGELLNYSSIAQDIGVSSETIKRWTNILETAGIIYLLQPYSNNHLKRAIKTPKVYMLDTGLMAYLTKWLTPETIQHGAKSGQFFETFVISQIIKSFANKGLEAPLYFYRDTNQKEIDLIIEHQQCLYPIEIKTTLHPDKKMGKNFKLLKTLPQDITVGNGIIMNQYPQKVFLAEDMIALPVSYI